MPRAPKHCGYRDCTELVPGGTKYCDDHTGWKTSPRTPSSARTSTREWKAQRAKALQRDGHWCTIRGPRCTVYATQVDHVKPVHLGGTDELTNLASVCEPCHQDKSQREARAARG
ncbi:MAG: HNH endonuclease [Mycolicibacterium sp.]|uniref:HNH endonuclease n=1 Tax=Mycolicibacterium sp. TaxID=2320850 RepID=UPI000FB8BF18|nr:HNH endonuclease signature motif containing protein [Mycolicibacterium sp.]RUP35021.1 MAG: HNH endonuclease [Mycolicibacterium sp.]